MAQWLGALIDLAGLVSQNPRVLEEMSQPSVTTVLGLLTICGYIAMTHKCKSEDNSWESVSPLIMMLLHASCFSWGDAIHMSIHPR